MEENLQPLMARAPPNGVTRIVYMVGDRLLPCVPIIREEPVDPMDHAFLRPPVPQRPENLENRPRLALADMDDGDHVLALAFLRERYLRDRREPDSSRSL